MIILRANLIALQGYRARLHWGQEGHGCKIGSNGNRRGESGGKRNTLFYPKTLVVVLEEVCNISDAGVINSQKVPVEVRHI